jgi:hypothetical protein
VTARNTSGMSQVVCVTGMHRSGTSVTSKLLNVLGVYLGAEEDLLGPRGENNPKGFFENRAFVRLNAELLQSTGGIWKEPPSLPAGWEADPRLDPVRERARAMLESTFGDVPLWGWKDPRSALTLPFWQSLLPGMTYVVCVRNPLDVAASLERRNQLPRDQGYYVWLRYLAAAIVHTSGRPRMFLSFEDYFEDWEAQVVRLAEFIGRPAAAQLPEVAGFATDWLEGNLWHHRSEPRDALRDPEVPLAVRSLYLASLRAAAGNDDELLDDYARALEAEQGWNAEPLTVRPPAWAPQPG